MATFVLVAGAWHGGWCWQRVTPLLREAGHQPYPATLTGLGERVHLSGPEVGIETHVQDVANVLRYEDLTDVILVGHSYSGLVIEAVAHRMPERIRHLIFIDALLPTDGRTLVETYEDHGIGDFWHARLDAVRQSADPWSVPPVAPDSPTLRVTDPADQAWMSDLLTPHPLGTFTTPVYLGNPAAAGIPRTFISCLPHPPGGLIPIMTAQVQADPDWNYHELMASHDPMITDPEALTRLLLECIS